MSARVSRRALFGGCTAGALLFGAAGVSKAAELDGELLALVAQLEAAQLSIEQNCAEATAANRAGDREREDDLDVETGRHKPV